MEVVRRTDVLWPDPTGGPWAVLLTWDLLDGRYECVGVEIRSYVPPGPGDVPLSDVELEQAQKRTGTGPRPVTAVMLRTLPIGTIVEAERAKTREWYEGMASAAAKIPHLAEQFTAEGEEWRRPGRRARHDPTVVARVYTEAWQASGTGSPTKAVAEQLGISHSAAAKQVARARALGLLPPTKKGRPQGNRAEIDTTTKQEESE